MNHSKIGRGGPSHQSDFGNKPDGSAMQDVKQLPVVAILAFAETAASAVHGMYDLLMSAGHDWGAVVDGSPGARLMKPLIVARSADPLTAINGVQIAPHATLAQCTAPDVVCVPELALAPGETLDDRFAQELAWLAQCYAAGATLATACSGALLLAEARLLDGQEATTHWAYCDVLQRRHPTVKVRPQRTLVVSGEGQRLIMGGGGTSWLDLGLYLIARAAGVDAAMQVARLNLIDWHDVGQQPFARLARSRPVQEDGVIAGCQTWIAEHYHEPSPVGAMVRLSGLAERSFKRRFQQATGLSPLEYVHTLRLEEAKQLLEAGDQPVEAIANAVGYEDAGFFSRLFRRKVNLTPAQYRRRFGSLRRVLEGGARSR